MSDTYETVDVAARRRPAGGDPMTGQSAPVPPPEAVEAVVRRSLEDAMGCKSGPFIDEQYGHACGSQAHTDALNNGCCDFAHDLAAGVVAALGHPNQDALARAWAEGKTAGLEQAADHVRTGHPNIRTNPYGGKP